MKLTELQDLMNTAASVFRYCVIGGGAPRDAFLGGPIKDIDLFVDTRGIEHNPLGFTFAELVDVLAKTIGGSAVVYHEGSIEEGHEPTYHIHWKGPVIEVLPVRRCVFTDIHDYDFGLSQIQMTTAGLTYTAKFQADMHQNTLTYVKTTGNDKSAKRLTRLMAKYPDRMPVNCGLL